MNIHFKVRQLFDFKILHTIISLKFCNGIQIAKVSSILEKQSTIKIIKDLISEEFR